MLKGLNKSLLAVRYAVLPGSRYQSNIPNRVSSRYINSSAVYHCSSNMSDESEAVAIFVKACRKFYNLQDDNQLISRHSYVAYCKKNMETAVDKIEAYFVNCVWMKYADIYGLDKFPEDGGKELTPEEMYEICKKIPKETQEFYSAALSRALFRTIDTNQNGYISRDEWSTHLKILNQYESEEQARRSFDSLDTNQDGQISMKEFEAKSVQFWTSSATENKDLYGNAQ